MLQDLEAAGAFTMSLDTGRSWFRYHQMFAALLRLELRRAEPGAVPGLHAACAGWLAAQRFAVEAVRQAQAAEDWELAARLLAGHWPALHLDGHAATVHELLAGFPAVTRAVDAELAVVAADELAQGSLEAAERYLTLAERNSGAGPAGARAWTGRAQLAELVMAAGCSAGRRGGSSSTPMAGPSPAADRGRRRPHTRAGDPAVKRPDRCGVRAQIAHSRLGCG